MLLVGATDTEYDGDPGDLRADPTEIETLLTPLGRLFEDHSFQASRVVHSFAGLRVLPRGDGHTARALRHHLVETSPSGLISVGGGKLTTHRKIAADALQRLPAEVRPRRIDTSPTPLPGSNGATGSIRAPRQPVDPQLASHLRNLYGSDARRVLAYADSVANALERVHPEGPDVLAQAYFARDEEYALAVDDILCRRTTLAMRGLADAAARERIAEVLNGQDSLPLPHAPVGAS
jgi:glycerol-3-phosphate dehydrogenase